MNRVCGPRIGVYVSAATELLPGFQADLKYQYLGAWKKNVGSSKKRRFHKWCHECCLWSFFLSDDPCDNRSFVHQGRRSNVEMPEKKRKCDRRVLKTVSDPQEAMGLQFIRQCHVLGGDGPPQLPLQFTFVPTPPTFRPQSAQTAQINHQAGPISNSFVCRNGHYTLEE